MTKKADPIQYKPEKNHPKLNIHDAINSSFLCSLSRMKKIAKEKQIIKGYIENGVKESVDNAPKTKHIKGLIRLCFFNI